MRLLTSLVLFSLCSVLTTPLMALEEEPGLTGCAAKRLDVSAQIDAARAQGNHEQLAGLEKSLSEIETHCNDAALKRERENKVLDAKREVSRRQSDLDKAMSQSDSEKINKRKDKLAQARKALQQALDELDQ